MAALWTPPNGLERGLLLRWVEQRLPGAMFDDARALPVAVQHGRKTVAVAIYQHRRGVDIEGVLAADTARWASRGTIAELLSYPFEILGCKRITLRIRSDNARAIRGVERAGFDHEGRLRCAYKDCDALIYGLTAAQWHSSRWRKVHEARHAPAQEAA